MTRVRKFSILSGSLFVLATALFVGALSDRVRRPVRPNVLVICADALRADHLGAYGYDRPTSPHFDALARRGVLFAHAYASASWTAPSIATLFVAEPPHVHGLVRTLDSLAEERQTLAEALSAAGYRTGAVSANFVHVVPRRGLGQGLDYFNVLMERTPPEHELDGDFPGYTKVPAARVLDAGLAWIRRDDRRPFFLYLHTMDTHAGYQPPPSFARAFDKGAPKRISGTAMEINFVRRGLLRLRPGDLDHLVDRYDAEIAYWDSALGTFLRRGTQGSWRRVGSARRSWMEA